MPTSIGSASRARTGRPPRRQGIDAVHAELRRMIISGAIAPNANLVQPRLAEELQVGRTQLREALRRLQEEGLVVAEHNRGMRVAEIDVERVDSVYAGRVLLEALGATMSVPHLSHADLDLMGATLKEMRLDRRRSDVEVWARNHAHFHHMVFENAPAPLVASIARYADMAERYWRQYQKMSGSSRLWRVADEEHEKILRACQHADAVGAAQALALHLSRTAMGLATELDPEYTRPAVTTAVRMVMGERIEGLMSTPRRGPPSRTREKKAAARTRRTA